MKKLVLILFAGISFATANAQGQFAFGIKGGLNLSDISVSNGFDGYTYSILPDYNIGAYFKVPLPVRDLYIQPEIGFSAQGFKGYDPTDGSYSEHVNYFNIPVLLKYAHRTGLFVETGPQLGIKLNAKLVEDGVSTDYSSAYNSADFSWVFGIGFKIPMSPVSIDVRYNTGLLNVANDSYYGNGYGEYGVRNGVGQIDVMIDLFHTRVR
jgi:hypothetical protein